ncbi:MAG: hypothetical protein ACE5H0_05300 [Bacteroidota bacterium]
MAKSPALSLAFVAVLFLGLDGSADDKQNRHVRIDVSVEPSSLILGAKGEIRIQFHPFDGIRINTVPPTELNLAEGSPLTLIGEPAVPTDPTTGYLDASKPMTYTFAVSKTARPGTTKVNGTLVYYYCSDKEGWCLRWKDNVSLTLSIDR